MEKEKRSSANVHQEHLWAGASSDSSLEAPSNLEITCPRSTILWTFQTKRSDKWQCDLMHFLHHDVISHNLLPTNSLSDLIILQWVTEGIPWQLTNQSPCQCQDCLGKNGISFENVTASWEACGCPTLGAWCHLHYDSEELHDSSICMMHN